MSFNNFTDFYYNAVPGIIFSSLWFYLFRDKINQLPTEILFIFILTVSGFLLGFFFQAILSILKDLIIDPILIFSSSKITKVNFSDMNRVLWVNKMEKLPQYFSCRSAFWGNIAIGSFISMLFIWAIRCYYSIIALSIFIFAISLYRFYRKKEIDTVVKIFNSLKKKRFNESRQI